MGLGETSTAIEVKSGHRPDALHSVMLRGWGVGDVALDLVVLGAYAAVSLLAAAVFIRRQA